MTGSDFAEITTSTPEKSLLQPLKTMLDVTTTAASLYVIKVADTNANIA